MSDNVEMCVLILNHHFVTLTILIFVYKSYTCQ